MPEPRHPALHLILLGLVLLPFSTGTDSGLPVLSYGLPWLGLAAVLAIPLALRLRTHHVLEFNAIFLALCLVLMQFASCWIPEQSAPSFARWLPNAIGLLLFLYVLAKDRAQSRDFIVTVLGGLTWSATLLACYFLVNLAVAFAEEGVLVLVDRTNGGSMALPWAASNVIAATLLLGVTATRLYTLLAGQTLWRILAAALQSLAIVITMSRGASALLMLFWLVQLICSRQFRALLIASIIGCALLVGFAQTQQEAYDVLSETRADSAELSNFNGRDEEWQEKADYWLSHPLEPIGYYASPQTFVHTAHNILLAFLVELGPVAMLTLVAFFLCIGRAIWRQMPRGSVSERQIRNCCLISWLVVGLNVQIEDPYYTQPYAITAWLLLAVWLKLATQAPSASPPAQPTP